MKYSLFSTDNMTRFFKDPKNSKEKKCRWSVNAWKDAKHPQPPEEGKLILLLWLPSTLVRRTVIKKANEMLARTQEKRNIYSLLVDYELVQSLWKSVWRLSKGWKQNYQMTQLFYPWVYSWRILSPHIIQILYIHVYYFIIYIITISR